jgi:peroxiredoxin
MAQLRQDYPEFAKRDTVVVAVGPEDASAFARYWAKNDLPYVGLPDPGHSVLKLYGQEIKLFKLGRMPAQVLVDRAGMARVIHYGHDMTDIPTTAENLAAIDPLNAEWLGRPIGP